MRDRVYIMGVRVGRRAAERATDVPPAVLREPVKGWDPRSWRIEQHVLMPELPGGQRKTYALTADEVLWIDTWNELLGMLGSHVRLPGSVVGADVAPSQAHWIRRHARVEAGFR